LKPDVCRRVVGRLPSPGLESRGWRHRSAFCWTASCEAAKKKFTVVYLVRSFGLMPESVSHDWHVQPSCQRPNRGPPERREFSPGGVAVRRNRLSSKLYKHTVRGGSRQLALSTEFPDDFHIGNAGSEGGRAASKSRFLTIKPFGMTTAWEGRAALGALYAQQYGLPLGLSATFGACILRSPRRKTRN